MLPLLPVPEVLKARGCRRSS
uniref:Uncharacterized protein n=1 Tax=Rhizophora mucronata TaxID=61149 RepID=A0A2P2Q5C2_RHIMU